MAKHYSKLKADIRAQWRRYAKQEMQRRGELPPDFQERQPGDGDLNPPDPKRVARRACCLAAVALRGLASAWAHHEQQEFLANLLGWIEQSGLDDEIEPGEREIVQSPASELDQRASVNASWRWEGVVVLAAALGRIPLPPHDQPIDPKPCSDAVGLFEPRQQLDQRFAAAAFDLAFDRFAYANRAIALHWRLRQFFNVEQKPIDFATFARGVRWAEFDLRGVDLINGDLGIDSVPISRAPKEAVQRTMSIASERHIAANWLIGWDATYSDVENPT